MARGAGDVLPAALRYAKALLTRMEAQELGDTLRVLEVAAGRGNDADLWSNDVVSELCAIDTAEGNVSEASERLPACSVSRLDPREENPGELAYRFDLVYCNPACISNAFKDKKSLSAVAAFLAACALPNGVVCGVCFSGHELWTRAQKSAEPSPKVRGPGFSVAFPSRQFKDVGTHFRIRIGDALVPEEHFLPNLQALIRHMGRCSMRFEGAFSLSELVQEYSLHSQLSDTFASLLGEYVSPAGKLPPEALDALTLMTVFVFRKPPKRQQNSSNLKPHPQNLNS